MPYKDPAKNAECKRQYSLKNREKERLRAREYRRENKEKVALAGKNWRENNPDKTSLYSKLWRENNRAQYNSLQAKRRANKMNATPKWLNEEDHKLIADFYEMAKQLELSLIHI